MDGVGAAAELVAGQPLLPERLEVVTGSSGAGQSPQAFGEELVVGLLQRRPGRERPGGEVKRDYEACKARAAEMSSSKSGTSASS